ncbi:MAG: phosphohydrolase [Deltaproteobacteria bacterium]|nr:phosphohydrolase [Deltaproteobacteria bacterium]
MAKIMCPGQDTRYWQPGDVFEVECAECGYGLEFFKDDAQRRCPKCGARVRNPKLNLGCAQWCQHAKECLGFDPKEAVAAAQGSQETLIDRLVAAVKKELGQDQARIKRSLSVLKWAQELLRQEKAEAKVVLAAALLHDFALQEAEGLSVAQRVMKEAGLDPETIEHVSKIAASRRPAQNTDTPELRVVRDASWLVRIPEKYQDFDRDQLKGLIDKVFKTEAGKELAYRLYL